MKIAKSLFMRRFQSKEQLEDRIEDMAIKAITKLVPKKVFDKPIPEQVRIARKMIGMVGTDTVRKNLIRDRGMPSDFRDMMKKGMSQSDIKNFYWQHEEFQEFWTVDLQMTEGMLDQLIGETYTPYREVLDKRALRKA